VSVLLLDIGPAHSHNVGATLAGMNGKRHRASKVGTRMSLGQAHMLEAPWLMPAVHWHGVGADHDRIVQKIPHERPLLHRTQCRARDLLSSRRLGQSIEERLHERRTNHRDAQSPQCFLAFGNAQHVIVETLG
jgi:hypothetical protein